MVEVLVAGDPGGPETGKFQPRARSRGLSGRLIHLQTGPGRAEHPGSHVWLHPLSGFMS